MSAQCVESNVVVGLGVGKKERQKLSGVANKSRENGPLEQPGSTQVLVNLTLGTSSDTSDAFVGQWDELMLGVRTNLEIQFLRERYAEGAGGFSCLVQRRCATCTPGRVQLRSGSPPVMAVWGFPRKEEKDSALFSAEADLPPIENPERGPTIALANEPARVSVSSDTFIARPDLGPNAYTFVAAGDQVPPEPVQYM